MHNSTRVISAWDGDKLVGLVRALDDGETVAFLHYLLVDPAYQGQYIGDELMKRIMSFYQNLLYVKVMPSDPKTIPFYQSGVAKNHQGGKPAAVPSGCSGADGDFMNRNLTRSVII